MSFIFKFIDQQAQNRIYAIVWTVIILIGCSLPGKDVPDMSMGIDKVVHCLMMAGFGFLWLYSIPKVYFVILLGTVYGFALEFWQQILPFGRTFDVLDGVADTVGVILGAIVWKIWPR